MAGAEVEDEVKDEAEVEVEVEVEVKGQVEAEVEVEAVEEAAILNEVDATLDEVVVIVDKLTRGEEEVAKIVMGGMGAEG